MSKGNFFHLLFFPVWRKSFLCFQSKGGKGKTCFPFLQGVFLSSFFSLIPGKGTSGKEAHQVFGDLLFLLCYICITSKAYGVFYGRLLYTTTTTLLLTSSGSGFCSTLSLSFVGGCFLQSMVSLSRSVFLFAFRFLGFFVFCKQIFLYIPSTVY